jgi:hypothetical protein
MQIETVVKDIYSLVGETGNKGYDFEDLGRRIGDVVQSRTSADSLAPREQRVWYSNVGSPCVRQLWYKLHKSDEAEPLLPGTRIKFLYGDLLEEMLLELVRASGHSVEFTQERLEGDGITGKIDAVIDGVLVDVKTASGFSFKKFKSGLRVEDDAFGYLGQLGGYLAAIQSDSRFSEVDKTRAAFLVLNKESGAIHLDMHEFSQEDIDKVRAKQVENKAAAEGETTPARAFEDVPEGKSGNRKLQVNCSYCAFKSSCWPELRTFLYAGGRPVHLTTVEREPNVPELRKENNND